MDRGGLKQTLEDMVEGDVLPLPYAKVTREARYWRVEPSLPGYRYIGGELPAVAKASASWSALDLISSLSWQVYNSLHGKEPEPMRTLYEVFIVDPEPKNDNVVYHGHVIATSEEKASAKAAVAAKIEDPDDYDFIIRAVGSIRNREKKA